MRTVANASVDVIEKFRGENSDLNYILNELRSAAWDSISQLKLECESKLDEYEDMANEAAEVVAKARNSRDSASKSGIVAQAESLHEYYQTQYMNIQQMLKTLNGLESNLFPMIDKALSMVQNADGCLQSALSAIKEYIDYRIKY